MEDLEKKKEAFAELLEVIATLRVECPWDRKQTMESLRALSIEEVYELGDAILAGDMAEVKKELGDLLMHIVFYAQIGSEKEAFDMAYNWPMKDLFNEIAATAGQNTYKNDKGESRTYAVKHAAAIDSLLADQAKNYPKDSYMMNMVTNHDLNSWEGTEFQRLGNLTDAFAVLSYTLPGMPLIYTGQETGLNRAFKFFDKDKAPEWEPRNKYFDFYKKLNTLKHDQKALRAGVEGGELVSYKMTSPDIYAFSREKDGSKVVVVVNLGKEAAEVKAADNDLPALDNMTDFFKGAAAEMPATLNPGEYRVFTGK